MLCCAGQITWFELPTAAVIVIDLLVHRFSLFFHDVTGLVINI